MEDERFYEEYIEYVFDMFKEENYGSDYVTQEDIALIDKLKEDRLKNQEKIKALKVLNKLKYS